MTAIFAYVTCATLAEAEKIARAAVESGLAACANIIPGMTSIYRWQGAIETANETVLILKTGRELFEPLREKIKSLHGYETPCIAALPVEAADADYLNWLKASTALGA